MNIEFKIWPVVGFIAIVLLTVHFFLKGNWIGLIGVIAFSMLVHSFIEEQKKAVQNEAGKD